MDLTPSLYDCQVRRSGKDINRVIITAEMEFSTQHFEPIKEMLSISTLTPLSYFADAIMRAVRNDLKRQRRGQM